MPNNITVQKCYVFSKVKVGSILSVLIAKELNIIKLQNLNKTLVECESGKNIKLQNVIEIIFDGSHSRENRSERRL